MAVPRSIASSTLAYTHTAGRAVHIKIYPRPLNISESRQVLHVLQEYGEVVMYKHLKHEPEVRAPNTALAIFGTKDAATRAVNASPLQFGVSEAMAVETPRAQPLQEKDLGELSLPEQKESSITDAVRHTSSTPAASYKVANQAPHSPRTTKEFRLVISPSTQNHAAYISRQHYNGRFKLETGTIMGQDLENRVPVPGMADIRWGLGEVPLRIRNARAEEERKEGRGWWKKGLGEMWREAQREKKAKDVE